MSKGIEWTIIRQPIIHSSLFSAAKVNVSLLSFIQYSAQSFNFHGLKLYLTFTVM